MATQKISDYNPLPEQTFDSDNVGVKVYTDEVGSGRAHDSLTGKRMIGLVDPSDVTCELTPELEPISSGSPMIDLEDLIRTWTGNCSAGIQDLNPLALKVANGTYNPIEDVEPIAPVTGTTVAGSTAKLLKLGVGEAAAFAPGDFVLIPLTNEPARGIVKAVDTGADTLTLKYELDELPGTGITIKKVIGYDMDWGGNALQQREIIFALDFAKGGSHRNVIYRAAGTSGPAQTMANANKVVRQVKLKIYGNVKAVTGLGNQIVPITNHVTYNAA